ncbi:copper-binding protein [Variovorax ginsengisoli]|uniref:Copper-binding protein n=1 Tax=Variovorax ginsengisoli TaxID=363844 RepID=A0ABT8S7D6_9BURK|nr:copper-binding protein [Variovorax ginsengisoli]MDN8614952.1 copper-binding protein [Variovorax ginsengisoli]MDO1534122.1 copper-binding protein [Variovorax ginsengisoli]
MMKRIVTIVALSLMACAAAQAQTAKGSASVPGTPWSVGTPPSMALTEGEVERVDKEHGEVVIDHGDLPNLGMPAMTMGFAVADKRMLDRLKPGDKVRFNAEIKNGEATVTYIESIR